MLVAHTCKNNILEYSREITPHDVLYPYVEQLSQHYLNNII